MREWRASSCSNLIRSSTPQPARIVRYVVNQSSRNGAHPLLLVVHSTESPNALGLQDVLRDRQLLQHPASPGELELHDGR